MCILISGTSGLSPLVNCMKELNLSFNSVPNLNFPRYTEGFIRISLETGKDLDEVKKFFRQVIYLRADDVAILYTSSV
jgi:hypothetical protein